MKRYYAWCPQCYLKWYLSDWYMAAKLRWWLYGLYGAWDLRCPVDSRKPTRMEFVDGKRRQS